MSTENEPEARLEPDLRAAKVARMHDNPAELKLLDWFAGCALSGLLTSLGEDYIDTPTLEHDCYLIARGMLKARAQHVRREDEEPPLAKGGWSP